MTDRIDFYFDFGSPTAYLAYKRLRYIEENIDCELHYKPVLLGGIFKATGNQSPVMLPQKAAYMSNDIPRFAKRYNAPFVFNPHFPINTITLMRAATALAGSEDFMTFVDAVYDAMWAQGKNMGELEIVAEVLNGAGLDAEAILQQTSNEEVKEALKVATGDAVEKGMFGLPVMMLDNQMYFGQDRLFFIEEALSPR